MSAIFGEYIRASREALKKKDPRFSLRQLAARIDVKPSYLSRIERGEAFALSEEKTIALAAELSVNPDVLLALSGKISSDVQEVIRKRPELFAEIIREFKDLPDSAVRADKEYRLMESRLQEAQHIAKIGSWEIDLVGGHLYQSDELFSIFEAEPGDERLTPDYVLDNLIVPEDRKRMRHDFDVLFPQQGMADVYCRFRTLSGKLRHGHVHGLVEYGPDGEPVLYRGTFQDVTIQREAEEALRQSEERYKAVLEDQTELICRTKADGTIIFLNEATCRFFGKTREELMGGKWQPMAVAEDLPSIESRLQQLSPENPVAVVENRVHAGDGSIRWMQFVNRGFFDNSGELREIQTVGRDITDRVQVEEKLKKSEHKYRLLAENVGDVLTLTDADLEDVYVSPSVKRLLGYEPEEFLRLPHKSFLTPDSLALLKASISRLKHVWNQGGRAESNYKMELVFIHRDGRKVPTEILSSPLFEGGRFSGMLNVIRDVADRKAAEKRHRLTDMQLAGILDHSPSAIHIKDIAGRFLLVNRQYEDLVGVALERLTGKTPHEFLPPHEAEEMLADDKLVIESGRPMTREETLHTAKGERDFLTTKFPVMDDGAEIYAVCCISTDITELKHSRQKLSESEEYHRMIFDTVGDMVLVYEPSGRIVEANRAAERTLGYTRAELLRLGKQDILSGAYKDLFEPRVGEILQEERQLFQAQYLGKDGRAIDVEVKAAVMRRAGKKYVLSVARDVSARAASQAGERGSIVVTDAAGSTRYEHRDTRPGNPNRGDAARDAMRKRRSEVVAMLAGDMANDLNNSLLPIILNVEMVRNRLREDPLLQRRLSDALDSAGRARDLVRRILELSRGAVREEKPMNAAQVAQDALRHIRSLAPANVTLSENLDPHCPPIAMDSMQMRRLLINVCDNAVKVMGPEGGLLDIRLHPELLDGEKPLPFEDARPGVHAVLTVAARSLGDGVQPGKNAGEHAGFADGAGHEAGADLAVARMITALRGGGLAANFQEPGQAFITAYLPAAAAQDGDGADAAAPGVSAGTAETSGQR